ncbi:c-type cytochrome domain-containing protein [Maribacter halichondriae]|uniref:c-type cytochrome domain-containing protein n=1 Tax=Maribacter halichondriae TaxID=2980554 RepID=UPI00235927DB|nr:c-type cytochrome domain-containing protein [Maribacter sp. Hal144]
MGGASAFVAAFFGWWLGETGLYEEDTLFIHRWLGIALVIIAFIGWWIKRTPENHSKLLHNGINILLLLMLFVEGHKGGDLTHGETYLTEYAPEPLQKLIGVYGEQDSLPTFGNPDSVLVYNDLISPIFKTKCIACHCAEVQRGGLDMSTPETLTEGGEGGAIIVSGNPTESELFRRITLPQSNVKFMPPTNKVLTYDEIKIVEWWIRQGASLEDPVATLEVTDNIHPVLLRKYGLDTSPKAWYERVRLTPLDSIQLVTLSKSGFTIKTLGGDNPLLDITYSGSDLTEQQLQELEKVKDYVAWLSLAQTNVEDEWLGIISNFTNLTRLELEKTAITDRGVSKLAKLEHLEVLNLYGTQVTDACLSEIQKFKGLKRVYLWGTDVTTENAKKLENDASELQVIIGKS